MSIKRWYFFIPVIFGVVTIVMLKQNSSTPKQSPAQEMTKTVRTLSLPQVTVTPVAIGYGTVRPVSTWEAVAQVEGIILEKHPDLGKGAIIEKGSLLLQIDPVDYELNIAQIEADILATKAQLEEQDTKLENTQASLEIEKKSLELTKKELKRLKKLLNKSSVSYSDFEAQERSMLAQQQSVLSQQNALKIIPNQKALLDAQLQQKYSQLKRAHRDLENTKIIMPFTGRISEDNVELAQYIRVGDTLAAADALDKAEIEVQIPISYFRGLLSPGKKINLLEQSTQQFNDTLGITAQVVLREAGLITTWDAVFSRLTDTLDPKTRTIGVIVEVKNPYGDVTPGSKPPLVKGFFVEVHLHGAARANSLVVPRSALHNKHIYLVNDENRLEIKKVNIDLYQPEFAVISSDKTDNSKSPLKTGDKIIISDLMPAIKGMLLLAQDDEKALNYLKNLIQPANMISSAKGVQ
ncbi:MAG: HlyD family efflux transporter periplasmic adaptor subunit [Gammaproteobacteria bacterium]|nr:HlyD family efflux transporter periplasmic adaptor subunit [Gammaproteobacteria bacterium]